MHDETPVAELDTHHQTKRVPPYRAFDGAAPLSHHLDEDFGSVGPQLPLSVSFGAVPLSARQGAKFIGN